jgi:hypothetical protein
VFVAGDMGLPEDDRKFMDVASLEDAGRQPPKRKRLEELEPFARSSGDLAKALQDHECEGPALCRVCANRREAAGQPLLAKAHASEPLDRLESVVLRFRRRG